MKQILPALVATLAAQLLVSMSVGTGPVLAPVAAASMGLSPEMIGTYIGIIYALAAITGLISGSFIQRFGGLRMMQVSLALSAVALAVSSFSVPVAAVACALLFGCANGPTTPASSHVLARVTPAEWRNAVFSTKQMGVPLGNGLAGLIMPVLALTFGWQEAVLTGAAMCVVLALILQPWQRGLDVGREPGRTLIGFGQVVGPLRLIFREPELRRLSIVSFIYAGMQNCIGAFLVTYLHDRVKMSLIEAGLVLTISQTAGAACRVLWGALTDRWIDAYRLLGGLGLGMTACALLTAAFTPEWTFWAIVLVASAFGATSTAWNGVFLAQIATLAPVGRVGEATGGSQVCTFGGVTLMPTLFSLVLAITGSYTVGFGGMAALTLLGGLWMLAAGKAPAPART